MAQSIAAVRSLFIPVEQGNALLPGTVVAEIVPYAEPSPFPDAGPVWLLGEIAWREQRVPLISVEAMIAGEPMAATSRARVAVLKALSNRPDLPYFAVVTRSIPRLLTVYEEGIEVLDEGEAPHEAVSCEVLANGEPAFIPNLERIEDLLYAALNP